MKTSTMKSGLFRIFTACYEACRCRSGYILSLLLVLCAPKAITLFRELPEHGVLVNCAKFLILGLLGYGSAYLTALISPPLYRTGPAGSHACSA